MKVAFQYHKYQSNFFIPQVFVSFGEGSLSSKYNSSLAASYREGKLLEDRRPPSGASQITSGSVSINLPVSFVLCFVLDVRSVLGSRPRTDNDKL